MSEVFVPENPDGTQHGSSDGTCVIKPGTHFRPGYKIAEGDDAITMMDGQWVPIHEALDRYKRRINELLHAVDLFAVARHAEQVYDNEYNPRKCVISDAEYSSGEGMWSKKERDDFFKKEAEDAKAWGIANRYVSKNPICAAALIRAAGKDK